MPAWARALSSGRSRLSKLKASPFRAISSLLTQRLPSGAPGGCCRGSTRQGSRRSCRGEEGEVLCESGGCYLASEVQFGAATPAEDIKSDAVLPDLTNPQIPDQHFKYIQLHNISPPNTSKNAYV